MSNMKSTILHFKPSIDIIITNTIADIFTVLYIKTLLLCLRSQLPTKSKSRGENLQNVFYYLKEGYMRRSAIMITCTLTFYNHWTTRRAISWARLIGNATVRFSRVAVNFTVLFRE